MKPSKRSHSLLAAAMIFGSSAAFAKTNDVASNPVGNSAGIAGVSAEVCKLTTKDEIQSLFGRWNASLQTLSPEKVTANYTDDAVLLPTVSNTPRTDHAAIQDYFVHFLQKKPIGVINQSHVKIGCNKAYDVGVYTFTLQDNAGKKQAVKARYSFVYDYKDGQWLISHHHSSAMPEVGSNDDAQAKKH